MSFTATITSQGQLSVPVLARRAMGLGGGGRVTLLMVNNSLLIKPAPSYKLLKGLIKTDKKINLSAARRDFLDSLAERSLKKNFLSS